MKRNKVDPYKYTSHKNVRCSKKLIQFNHIKIDRILKSIFGPAIINDQMEAIKDNRNITYS